MIIKIPDILCILINLNEFEMMVIMVFVSLFHSFPEIKEFIYEKRLTLTTTRVAKKLPIYQISFLLFILFLCYSHHFFPNFVQKTGKNFWKKYDKRIYFWNKIIHRHCPGFMKKIKPFFGKFDQKLILSKKNKRYFQWFFCFFGIFIFMVKYDRITKETKQFYF